MPVETAGGPATPNFRRTPTNSGLAKELHSFAEAAGLVAAFLFSLLVVALLLAALLLVVLFRLAALGIVDVASRKFPHRLPILLDQGYLEIALIV